MRLQLATIAPILVAAGVARGDGLTTFAVDTLVYTDTDNVVVVSPQAAVKHAFADDGGELGARVVVDAISAASVDVISAATTRFSEVREEVDVAASRRLGAWLPALRYRFSTEPDWRSHGGGVAVQRRLGGADTTLSAAYDLTLDTVGRSGTPFDVWSRSLTTHSGELSLTQVLSPTTVVRVVYTLVAQTGYLEKPYRYVPLFDPAGIDAARADGVTLDLDTFDRYRLPERPPEEVPDRRFRHAAAVRGLRYVRALDGSLRADYRFYGDSWGVFGHTVELALAVPIGESLLVEVYDRAYLQTAARFWRREYVVAAPGELPRWRSVDRDLGSYVSDTLGARLEWRHAGLGLAAYAEADVMGTRFSDYLFLERRLALVGQLGLRWSP